MESPLAKKWQNLNRTSVQTAQSVELEMPTKEFNVPTDFGKFNDMIGSPIHPGTGERTPIFDYQDEYFKAWQKHHKQAKKWNLILEIY